MCWPPLNPEADPRRRGVTCAGIATGSAAALAALLLGASPGAALAQGRAAPAEAPAPGAHDPAAAKVAASVLARLDQAWNALDGERFAAEFTEDADVININGSHFQGRPDLARQMQFIFDTRFKGSRHRERHLELARSLSPDLMLVVSSAAIDVPSGPLAPEARSRQTFLLQRWSGGWKIRHWHNTPLRQATEGAPRR